MSLVSFQVFITSFIMFLVKCILTTRNIWHNFKLSVVGSSSPFHSKVNLRYFVVIYSVFVFTCEPRSAAESTCDFVVVVIVETLPKIGSAAQG